MAAPLAPTDHVVVDGVALLKIVNHCEQAQSGYEQPQGVMLGMVNSLEKSLEVTNCFPIPPLQPQEDQQKYEEKLYKYQMDMMRNYRHVNIDSLVVGFYQSAYFGTFVTSAFLESLYEYQENVQESIVLVYDPLKTSQGFLSLRAFRLTTESFAMMGTEDFSSESLRDTKMTFERLFEELPICFRNSSLVNGLLCELEERNPLRTDCHFLDIGTSSVLEKSVRLLMNAGEDFIKETNGQINYLRQYNRTIQMRNQYVSRREEENGKRKQRGEPPLPEEDLSRQFKLPPAPSRQTTLLTSSQVTRYSRQLNEFAAQSLAKLFAIQSLQQK